MAWIYTHNLKDEDIMVEELFAKITMSNLAKSINVVVIEDKADHDAVVNGVKCYTIHQIWKKDNTYYEAVSYITPRGRIILIANNSNIKDFSSPTYLSFFGGFYFK